jgi:hypothetical protein
MVQINNPLKMVQEKLGSQDFMSRNRSRVQQGEHVLSFDKPGKVDKVYKGVANRLMSVCDLTHTM